MKSAGSGWRTLGAYRKEWQRRQGSPHVIPLQQFEAMMHHLQTVREMHQQDLPAGCGSVILPHALAKEYRHTEREWGWQWVFPQRNRWKDAASGKEDRHHQDPSVVQKKAVKQTVKCAGLTNRQGATRSSIRSQPICWSAGKISEPFRTDGPLGSRHHHDLHPRSQARPDGSHQSSRPAAAAAPCGYRVQ